MALSADEIQLAIVTAAAVVAFLRGSEWIAARARRRARARREVDPASWENRVLSTVKATEIAAVGAQCAAENAAARAAALAAFEGRVRMTLTSLATEAEKATREAERANASALSAWGFVAALRVQLGEDLATLRTALESRADTMLAGSSSTTTAGEASERDPALVAAFAGLRGETLVSAGEHDQGEAEHDQGEHDEPSASGRREIELGALVVRAAREAMLVTTGDEHDEPSETPTIETPALSRALAADSRASRAPTIPSPEPGDKRPSSPLPCPA